MSIDQWGIIFTGVLAVFLTQCTPRYARFACLFGMAGQPFWFVAAVHAQQPGVFIVCCLYTLAWGKGILMHWVRR